MSTSSAIITKEKKFKTKTGYCHILSDKIVLTKDGVIGSISKIVSGNSIAQVQIINFLISLIAFFVAYYSYQKNEMGNALFFSILGLFIIYSFFISFNNSTNPVIDRQAIKEVKYKKAIPLITRAYFEVHFQDHQNQLKKRLIMLPGSLSNGDQETDKALKIMKEEKLI